MKKISIERLCFFVMIICFLSSCKTYEGYVNRHKPRIVDSVSVQKVINEIDSSYARANEYLSATQQEVAITEADITLIITKTTSADASIQIGVFTGEDNLSSQKVSTMLFSFTTPSSPANIHSSITEMINTNENLKMKSGTDLTSGSKQSLQNRIREKIKKYQ